VRISILFKTFTSPKLKRKQYPQSSTYFLHNSSKVSMTILFSFGKVLQFSSIKYLNML